MSSRRAFRPTALDGLGRLEERVVPSQLGVTRLVAPHPHAGAHAAGHHHGPRHPAARYRAPGTAIAAQEANVAAVFSLMTPLANSPAVVDPPPSGMLSTPEQTIVDLVNQRRRQAGLAPLQVDARLVEAAQVHSRDMARLGQMSHTLPGTAEPTLQDRVQAAGYPGSYLGENIAFNYPDANAVMLGWMNSPDHRANILDPNFTQIGVAIAHDAWGDPYYTQDFGRPS